MNTPPLPPRSSTPQTMAVHTRRCVRHTTREAAARCLTCGGFFCRECVVEHGGRVLCTECLAKASAARGIQSRRWPAARRTANLLTASAVAWLSFYGLGLLLLKMPATFHDETHSTSSSAAQEP